MEVVPQGCHEPQLTRLKPLAWPERSRPADPHHRCCTWLSSVRESTNGRDFVKLNVSLRTLEYVQPSPKRRASCVEHGSLSLFDTHPVYFSPSFTFSYEPYDHVTRLLLSSAIWISSLTTSRATSASYAMLNITFMGGTSFSVYVDPMVSIVLTHSNAWTGGRHFISSASLFFTRDSAVFRRKLPHPPPPGEFTKGSSDNYPLVLEDALQIDFERFLWVFYNPCVYLQFVRFSPLNNEQL